MARIFLALLFLLALGLGLALYQQWVTVAVTHPDSDHTNIEVGVHREKFHEDIDRARKQLQKSGATEVKGTLATVDANQKRVTLQHADGTVALEVGDTTQIRIGDRKAALADLRSGMKAAVRYTSSDGRNLAQSIQVEKEAP